jgi:hypothetical protein
MSFKILECNMMALAATIPPGTVSLDKRGQCRLHAADLAKLKITDQVTVLADAATLRVGFRKPRPEEKPFRVSPVSPKAKRPNDGRRINVMAALTELRIDSEKATGRYPLHDHKDLLYFCVAEVPGEPEAGDDDESENEDAS